MLSNAHGLCLQTFQTPSENHFFPSKHRLQHNITARYVRVLLKDWIKHPQITMELYGCEGKLVTLQSVFYCTRTYATTLVQCTSLQGHYFVPTIISCIACRFTSVETIREARDMSWRCHTFQFRPESSLFFWSVRRARTLAITYFWVCAECLFSFDSQSALRWGDRKSGNRGRSSRWVLVRVCVFWFRPNKSGLGDEIDRNLSNGMHSKVFSLKPVFLILLTF